MRGRGLRYREWRVERREYKAGKLLTRLEIYIMPILLLAN